MKDKIILMNFTDIYKEQEFYRETDPIWLEFSHLTGCSCYCDEEAAGILRKEMRELPAEGIHFLDSGNYHYISLFWLEKTDRPFRLVLFDNHTDMQPPAFGGLLSCGGWAAEAMETVPALKEVILVGPDEEAFSQTDAKFREKVRFLQGRNLKILLRDTRRSARLSVGGQGRAVSGGRLYLLEPGRYETFGTDRISGIAF